jgi:transposase InsO family protein
MQGMHHCKAACPAISQGKLNGDKGDQRSDVSDLWGPARTQAPGGDRYFVTFTDGKARRTMTYFMKEKSEALTKFKQYKSFVETQTGQKLKKLRVDGGGEFINKEFKKFLLDNGIQLEVTAPHSPSQNRIAERLN